MKIRRGIYAILNLKEDIKYIGSSINIYNRVFDHKKRLKENRHYNKQLQEDYNRLGKEWFKYVIVEEIDTLDRDILYNKEKEYIIILKGETKLYNQGLPTLNGGTIHDDNIREKLKEITNNYIKNNPEEVEQNKIKSRLAIEKDREINPEKYKRKGANLKTQKIVAEDNYTCHIFNSITEASQTLNLEYKRIGEVLIGKKNIGVGKYREITSYKGWKFYYYKDRYNRNIEVKNIISENTSIGFENFS